MEQGEYRVSEDTLLCAFDYACGRKTYVVSHVVRDISANANELSRSARQHIIKKITEMDTFKMLGHEQDAAQWQGLRDHLNEIESEVQE